MPCPGLVPRRQNSPWTVSAPGAPIDTFETREPWLPSPPRLTTYAMPWDARAIEHGEAKPLPAATLRPTEGLQSENRLSTSVLSIFDSDTLSDTLASDRLL